MSSLNLNLRLQACSQIINDVYESILPSLPLSDGNDKIEDKLKEKQKKKTNAPTKESQKSAKRKKVDLTFDYDPEKECKSII